MIHKAFLPPACCARFLPRIFADIDNGTGEAYLGSLCHECRSGKDIIIDLTGSDSVASFQEFFEATGFRPIIITDERELVQYFLPRQSGVAEPLPGALQAALAAVQ